uniref:Uncharacterized protein n=1 Tax=Amphilophus citrinellus TaxID=61819 RepID=A0A3Q0RCA4_AMPCI
MSLSEKSNEELGRLLSEYGIKHGPIVVVLQRITRKPVPSYWKCTNYRSLVIPEKGVHIIFFHFVCSNLLDVSHNSCTGLLNLLN